MFADLYIQGAGGDLVSSQIYLSPNVSCSIFTSEDTFDFPWQSGKTIISFSPSIDISYVCIFMEAGVGRLFGDPNTCH